MRRILLDYIAPAIAYFLVARLSLFLAIPPSEAAAIWPAAGIAIATLLLRGKRAWLGIYLGALGVYMVSWLDLSSQPTLFQSLGFILLLSLGPALQALFVTLLVRSFVDPRMMLLSEREILKFMFVYLPLGCLVSATWGMGLFWLYHIIDLHELPFNWLTWWVGDTIGAVTIAPLLLIFLNPSDRQVFGRRLTVGLPMILLLAGVVAFFHYNQQRHEQEARLVFEDKVNRLHSELKATLSQGLNAVYSLKSFLESSEYVSPLEFERFASGQLKLNPYLQALEWIPKISREQRLEFEQDSHGPGKITEPDQFGVMVPVADKNVYYPVKYLVPMEGNEKAFGFDVSSNPSAQMAQQQAIKTGQAIATRPIRLVQANYDQNGLVVYLPVYKALQFKGYAAAVIRTEELLNGLVARSLAYDYGLTLQVDDFTDGVDLVYRSTPLNPVDQLSRLQITEELEFCGRRWRLHFGRGEGGASAYETWESSVILLGGMAIVALIGAWLLSLTGRTLQISREVERRTLELRQEVAEREQVQKELTKLSLAVEHSPNMVLISDPAGKIEYINPKFTEVSGYSLLELSGSDANLLYLEQYGEGYYDALVGHLQGNKEWKGEIHSRKKSGELYWTQVLLAPVFDERNQLTHVVSVYQDITEHKLINEKMAYQARHDRLTGLGNRYEFERQLQRVLDEPSATRGVHAFCFCDLDQFKVINDVSGHAAGDELLKQISALLQSCVRRQDVLARLGGDEFGILMEGCTLDEAEKVANKILAQLEQFRFVWEGALHKLGVSIGVVAIDEKSHNITEIFKNADSACYTAKDAGRNRVHVYRLNDELLERREGEISWVGEINSALEEDRFELHGQMIVPILDDTLKPSIEVLVRLRRGEEMVMPGAFLPAAERYGLSPRLDRWVVKHAFQWLAEHPELGEVIDSLALNLCGHSLGDNKLLDFIYQELERKRFSPSLVKFEITETSAIANLAETQKFIRTVKSYGCGFSLDDFGSGLSSFGYLKNLPVDYLKIDGMFVKDIAHDPIDRAMVKSINEIGQVMNKKTIAEFVENDEILDVLRHLGVDYAQGYGIGRPKPLEELLHDALLKSSVAGVSDQ